MKATIIYFPNESKKSQKNGRIPLYMRICFKGLKSESRLNAEITEQELQKWDPMTMRFMERNFSINHQLNRLDQKFNDFLILNATSLPKYSPASIKDHVLGNLEMNQITLMKYVDEYFEKAVVNNVDRTAGTIKNYRRSINHLKSFLNHTKKQSMVVEELNFEFAAAFKNYLVNTDTSIKRVGMTEVSASGIIKKFRTIFSHAVNEELLKRNPFNLLRLRPNPPVKNV